VPFAEFESPSSTFRASIVKLRRWANKGQELPHKLQQASEHQKMVAPRCFLFCQRPRCFQSKNLSHPDRALMIQIDWPDENYKGILLKSFCPQILVTARSHAVLLENDVCVVNKRTIAGPTVSRPFPYRRITF
jgi:hypothetical protein